MIQYTKEPTAEDITEDSVAASMVVTSDNPKILHYIGIWPEGATPSDADVKNAVGALVWKRLSRDSGEAMLDFTRCLDPATDYTLHCYAEDENADAARGNTVAFRSDTSGEEGATTSNIGYVRYRAARIVVADLSDAEIESWDWEND